MKYGQLSNTLRFALSMAIVVLLCGGAIASAKHFQSQSNSTSTATPPQQISPEGRATLQAIIQSGNLPDLRWPNFSDYSKHLQKLYDSYGYALPWVRGMEPSPQARQIIALIQQAEEKGLNADDYDGPRWSARLALLKPLAANPMEADAMKFDVALTVCLMRYISDLHIGKVNPKHFDFDLNVETKKYDLPELGRRSQRTATARSRIALAAPTISSAVSPLTESATSSAETCACVARPSMIPAMELRRI